MIDSMMSSRLQTGDAVHVRPTGEIGLLVRIDRLYPASALVPLGADGLWAFPIDAIDRIDDLQSFFRKGRERLRSG
jgi:hypothetical protein